MDNTCFPKLSEKNKKSARSTRPLELRSYRERENPKMRPQTERNPAGQPCHCHRNRRSQPRLSCIRKPLRRSPRGSVDNAAAPLCGESPPFDGLQLRGCRVPQILHGLLSPIVQVPGRLKWTFLRAGLGGGEVLYLRVKGTDLGVEGGDRVQGLVPLPVIKPHHLEG